MREQFEAWFRREAVGWSPEHLIPNEHGRYPTAQVNDAWISYQAGAASRQAEIDALKAELAKCGRDNCMGQYVEGVAQWVRKERLDEAVKLLSEARRWHDDGDRGEGLPRQYWSKDYAAMVDAIDTFLGSIK